MLINLRNELMSGKRLPYDAEVEYLETDGSAYINTGAKIYNDTSVVVVWYSNYSTSTSSYFFGSDSSTDRFYLREYNGNASFSTGSWWQNTNISTVGTHTIEMSNNGISVDGTPSSRTGADKTGAGNFCLFKVAAGNSPSGMRCYSCKVYQSNILVRDLIPVRVGSGASAVGYMYDRVSGKLFGNAGTGDFVLGPDVVPVEYTESTGTQYIELPFGFYVTDEVFARISINTTQTTDKYMVAPKQWNTNNNRFALGVHVGFSTDSKYTAAFGGSTTAYTALLPPTTNDGNLHDWHYANMAFEVTDLSLSLSVSSITFGGATANLKLFYGYNTKTSGKIARYKHIKNGVVVIDLISVRIGTDATSWEGAMMDTLTRRIYRNAGTGAFSYGNDLKYPIPA